MAVGGEDELHIQSPALGVALGLVKAVPGWKTFLLGFDKCQGNRLRVHVDLDSQDIINLASRAPPGLAVDDFHRASRLFTPNENFRPSALVNGWIDELSSGVRFVEVHQSTFRRVTRILIAGNEYS